jgi:hypothetical protein
MITHAPTAAELRSHSSWLLAHAQQLREEAEQARLRAVQRREQSPKGVASWEREDALNRHPLQCGTRL